MILLGACTLVGALHALTLGHGRLLAAYLVGGQGAPRQAITLGVVITFSHTAAVMALGGVLLVAGRYAVPGAVVPVLRSWPASWSSCSSPVLSRLTSRRPGWITARVPLLSAFVVAILGCAMTVTGVSSLIG